jgi:1-pyrroline-5-carboxylate dehydrogenase
MSDVMFTIPTPRNEPVLGYLPGSPEKAELKAALKEMAARQVEIPLVIDGQEVRTGRLADCLMPHKAGEKEVKAAIKAAEKARPGWAAMPFQQRAAILLKAAELLAGRRRMLLNAATMLGQSKTAFQAEIDSAAELIDFWRYNPHFAEQILREQPRNAPGTWNTLEQRPLDGFVFAVTPFNFTSIAGNLPTAPALMGNTVVWKPASSSVLSGWYILQILREAGLPDGVINFVPGSGGQVGNPVMAAPELGGVHFTGSTGVFHDMWRTIGGNIANYRCYPRLVGETGGKDFIFAHASADVDALVTAMVCSAASRAYIPQSLWPQVKAKLLAEVAALRMGDVADFRTFMGAVIDQGAYNDIKGFIDRAKKAKGKARIIAGGGCDPQVGWFIEPTVIEALDPLYETMVEEIFGPVLTLPVYADKDFAKMLKVCDRSAAYALTGAIFAQDRSVIIRMKDDLQGAAGNFYINDKPTGAVVGQQPFGGSRASGTNDKAGSYLNLIRWVTPRAVKETFDPPRAVPYPYMSER